MPEDINQGVLLGSRPEDWVVGANIPFESRLPDADWRPYLPPGERQRPRTTETMACVSFSANNCVETQIKFLAGIDVNLSDRWLAKMSNTQTNGNYLWRVGDTLRKLGCARESDWPVPPGDFSWAEYYSDIPAHITGGWLLDLYDIKYERIVDLSYTSLRHELEHAPIQVATSIHAIEMVACEGDLQHYFDSYSPYLRSTTKPFVQAQKYVVTIKNTAMTEAEVKALQSLEGYSDPEGVTYWAGKRLLDYLRARLPDKEAELKKALEALNG